MPFQYVPLSQCSDDSGQHSSRSGRPPTQLSRVLAASQALTQADRYYPVDLSTGALIFTLPSSLDLIDGAFVGFVDLLSLANVNPITVNANADVGDMINVNGVIGASDTINLAGVITLYFLYKGVWRPFRNAT